MSVRNNYDVIDNCTPENIANIIFNNDPKNHNLSQQLLIDMSEDDISLFEILLIILLEGIEIKFDIKKIDNLTDEILNNFLFFFNQWFYSLGYKLHIHKITLDKKEYFDNYYCKIITNHESHNEKNYSFILNKNHFTHKIDKFKDFYAIYENTDYGPHYKFQLLHIIRI